MTISTLSRRRRPRCHFGKIRLRLEHLEDRRAPSINPIDVIGHLPAREYDQYIRDARFFRDGSVFMDWGNEPFIAVNPVDRDEMAISTFAYGSAIQSGPGATRASIWYSSDGGSSWGIRFPITESPVPGAGNRVPGDQTIAFDSHGVLHAAMLAWGGTGDPLYQSDVFHGVTANPGWDGIDGRPESSWQWNTSRVNLPAETNNLADQPWLALQGDHVFVGYDFFHSPDYLHAEMRVSASTDGGATFTADNPISSGGQMRLAANPGLRLATDDVGNVYSIFGIADSPFAPDSGKPNQLHYRLNVSSDGGQTWKFTDVGKKPGGLVIDDGWSLQFGSLFGGVNRLRGNITAIAADPSGTHVYAVYGKQDASGTDRIYLAEFHPDPGQPGQLVRRDNPVALSVPGQRSAFPAVAVTDSGAVGVMYYTFAPGDGQFHVHLATSTDQGLSFADQDIYDFNPTGIPYPGDRLLGDYMGMVSVGNKLFGTFGGRGNTSNSTSGIDTTDKLVPFFFSVNVAPGHLNALGQPFANNANSPQQSLRPADMKPLFTEAVARWGKSGIDVASLQGIDVRIGNLGGLTLGQAFGNTIWVDDDAAGWGWFVDSTPGDDSEFLTPGNQGERNRMDLLTVLEHEIGHLLGLEHQDSGVMVDTLPAGMRRLPESVANLFDVAGIDWLSVAEQVLPTSQRKR